jgi:hypothetical protein
MNDLSGFSTDDYLGGVINAGGFTANEVEISSVEVSVETSVDFGSARITKEQAEQAVASSNGVPAANVTVTLAGGSNNAARRLAAAKVVISLQDLAKAKSVMTSSADIKSLEAALSTVTQTAFSLPPQTIAPAATVTVTTAIKVLESALSSVQSTLKTNLAAEIVKKIPGATSQPMTFESGPATTSQPTAAPTPPTPVPTPAPTPGPMPGPTPNPTLPNVTTTGEESELSSAPVQQFSCLTLLVHLMLAWV